MASERMRFAVVGGGVAGVVAAYLLQSVGDVVLLEKQTRIGGHTDTFVVPSGPDEGLAIDTGFIVLNERTYPTFHRFLAALDVPVQPTTMSFSFSEPASGYSYAGTGVSGLFHRGKNLVQARFWRTLRDGISFAASAEKDLLSGNLQGLSLHQYLQQRRVSRDFIDDYVVPFSAAIWSSPDAAVLEFPAATFVRFFANHGLLRHFDAPRWQTVAHGSHSYLKAFQRVFRGEIRAAAEVVSVQEQENSVIVREQSGQQHTYDYVVIATHADEALSVLPDASSAQRAALQPWRYQMNEAVLHTDVQSLPRDRCCWASWNYLRHSDAPDAVSATYYMNMLQRLPSATPYLVTLNPKVEIAEECILKRAFYQHPLYTADAVDAQAHVAAANASGRVVLCGSYCGYGFHEDAVCSALAAVERFGVSL